MHNDGNNDNARDYRSLDSFSSAVPSSTSFDDSSPTLGYDEDLLSPVTGLEIDALSLCSQELSDVVDASRSDSALPVRVDTLGLALGPEFVQPLCDPSIIAEGPNYATITSTGVAWLADLSPADEYNPQSEPEPPDPSCASH